MKNKATLITAFIFAVFLFAGWGAVGHKLINRKTQQFFPPQMNAFQNWRDSLAAHGSDADYRKSSDTTESRRHYIDIDDYSGFILNHRIPQNIDSLNNLYGYNVVINNGIVPFAIIAYTDSVKQAFLQHNFQKAMLKSADLGHYVGDAHNPLHDTKWYNGWSTFSNGIHSRYETGLISRDSAFIQYTGDSIYYISNINQYAFDIVYNTYVYVDSVYRADSIAHVIAGSNNNTQYYQEFWNRAGTFTIMLFKNASKSLASLIYTAWVNAGSPVPSTGIEPIAGNIKNYRLYQNYPNPFNPVTKIRFDVPSSSDVKLSIYDITGKQISTLVNEKLNPGEYEVNFNAVNLTSGTYFYKIQTDGYSETKRMMLIK